MDSLLIGITVRRRTANRSPTDGIDKPLISTKRLSGIPERRANRTEHDTGSNRTVSYLRLRPSLGLT